MESKVPPDRIEMAPLEIKLAAEMLFDEDNKFKFNAPTLPDVATAVGATDPVTRFLGRANALTGANKLKTKTNADK
jgi:hypothetical protein